jgi:SET domain-containing protein
MLLVDTFVGPSVIEGVGVFAAEPIPAGRIIYRFDPLFDRLISPAELATFPESIRHFILRYTYPHPADKSLVVLDVDNGRHMNHSLHPNTDFRDATFGYAIRDIAAGEEITCNYAEFEPDFEMLPSMVSAFHPASSLPAPHSRFGNASVAVTAAAAS